MDCSRAVDPTAAEEFMCPVCLTIPEDCVETSDCGHLLCQACAPKLRQCPVCKTPIKSVVVSLFTKRKISLIPITCAKANLGCAAIYAMKHEQEHQEQCGWADLICVCFQVIQRRNLEAHKLICPDRLVVCKDCSKSFPAKIKHEQTCEYAMIYCSNKCRAEIRRAELKLHLSACPLQIISCSFSGCDSNFPRKKQAKHNQEHMAEHFQLLIVDNAKMIAFITSQGLLDKYKDLDSPQLRIVTPSMVICRSFRWDMSFTDIFEAAGLKPLPQFVTYQGKPLKLDLTPCDYDIPSGPHACSTIITGR